jgi:hypothetical protein
MNFPKIQVKGWFKGIILGALALMIVVACRSQPTVETPQNKAGDSTAKLTQLKFGLVPTFLLQVRTASNLSHYLTI